MPIVNCPDCGRSVSDQAAQCPDCARPIAAPTQVTGGSPAQQTAVAVSETNSFSIAGIICGIASLFVFWIVLGPLGLVLGSVAKSRGEPKANGALVVAGIGTIGGAAFAFTVMQDAGLF